MTYNPFENHSKENINFLKVNYSCIYIYTRHSCTKIKQYTISKFTFKVYLHNPYGWVTYTKIHIPCKECGRIWKSDSLRSMSNFKKATLIKIPFKISFSSESFHFQRYCSISAAESWLYTCCTPLYHSPGGPLSRSHEPSLQYR